MPFVLDASISASWCLADEASPVAERADALLDTDTALVPRIWWYETRNLLVVNERRGRITPVDSATFLRLLRSYPIEFDQGESEEAILQLARQFQLSFYHAAYLEIAYRRGIPLATLDKALQMASESAGVPLLK